MIQHIVLFKVRAEAPETEIASCVDVLRGLPAQIPEIESYRVSLNRAGRSAPYHIALVSTFADAEALARYDRHPAHVAFVEQFRSSSDGVVIFDSDEADDDR